LQKKCRTRQRVSFRLRPMLGPEVGIPGIPDMGPGGI
jgi:hypothetical protein